MGGIPRLDSAASDPLSPGHRRAQSVPRPADHAAHADFDPGLVEIDRPAREGLLHFPARFGNRRDRRLRFAGPLPLLFVLGSDADPHVFPDWHLGTRPPHLRGAEIRTLYNVRLD